MRVMFVDDDPALLKATAHLLRKDRARWQLQFAEGGEAALAALAGEPIDLVISDLRMPRVDGLRVMACLSERDPAVIRILISGGSEEDPDRLLAHAHEVFGKPFPANELRAVLARIEALISLVPDRELRARAGRCDPHRLFGDELRREVDELVRLGGPQMADYLAALWRPSRGGAFAVV